MFGPVIFKPLVAVAGQCEILIALWVVSAGSRPGNPAAAVQRRVSDNNPEIPPQEQCGA